MRPLLLLLACTIAFAAEMTPEPDKGLTEKDKGTLVGAVQGIEKGKVSILADGKLYVLWPKWVKEDKGFDKKTLAEEEKLKVGDQVTVEWAFQEHRRILSIAKVEAKSEKPDAPKAP